MVSPRSGREVANQFIIYGDNGERTFQSYRTVIARIANGQTILDPNWDYSNTTGKYRNLFLGESKRETEEKIKDGTYIITNLN